MIGRLNDNDTRVMCAIYVLSEHSENGIQFRRKDLYNYLAERGKMSKSDMDRSLGSLVSKDGIILYDEWESAAYRKDYDGELRVLFRS